MAPRKKKAVAWPHILRCGSKVSLCASVVCLLSAYAIHRSKVPDSVQDSWFPSWPLSKQEDYSFSGAFLESYANLFDTFNWMVVSAQSLLLHVCECPPWTWPLWASTAVPLLLIGYATLRNRSWSFLFGCVVVVSLGWEFVRIYQVELAKKVAITLKGMPLDCFPEQMTTWQSFLSLISENVRWQTASSCEEYHLALMVHPLWEVNPLTVVLTTVSRCVTVPCRLATESVAQCFRVFFSHIPVQWHLFFMLLIPLIAIVVLIMAFRYRFLLPFVLRLEPASSHCSPVKSVQ
ncbi:hypothetical protein CAPTEDRAFT_223902 [Capitella teleta]|uniref:Chloride channel CLIC-like protein 1 n=1 Tax=Capitella teleta TaxID=283909 RepID=R7VA71_CAPTE|nr:hypothetical protein CAPTEDRAFT_223902 [Capitella teleta]|eukprot:ELU15703.1 hypothetical protein CAPTEDRAFT_223902 [Capitella teleta]